MPERHTQHHTPDPWELSGDALPGWRASVEDRALSVGNVIDRNARWALFAVQELVVEIHWSPFSPVLSQIALCGSLTNGVMLDGVNLALILRGGTSQAQRHSAWDQVAAVFKRAEQRYGLDITGLLLTEEELVDPTRWPQRWQSLMYDALVIWPEESRPALNPANR